jgi:hypothetical protein
MEGRKDMEGAGNYGSDHKSVSSQCEREDGDCENIKAINGEQPCQLKWTPPKKKCKKR